MTQMSDAKFEGKLICCFKNEKNLVNFELSSRSSQNFHFAWFLVCKVYNIWPKKVQRRYLSRNSRVMHSLKKNWLVVRKMTLGIWQIFTRTLEKSQNWDFDGMLSKQKMYKLKIYREVMCHVTLKRNWLAVSKLTLAIWRILTLALQSLKNLLLNGLLLNKVHIWAKKVQKSYVSWH